MASLPPQSSEPRSSQSSSQHRASSLASSQRPRRSSIPRSATSEDSQTVLLNHPSSSESIPESNNSGKQHLRRPKARSATSSKDPRKCWICFSDETEDDPTSSEWRSPCPCALTAHEACLLDWVADLEAPNKPRSGSRPKVECPQCKGKITIARPRSFVVEGVQAIERATGRLEIPVVFVTLAGAVITGCWMYGFSTIYVLFGPEDADRLLGMNKNGMDAKWGLGLPFIPVVLVAARTTYADNILPILPIFYFASSSAQRESRIWPPSAAMAVASIPYIRGIYNTIYKNFFADREKAWLKGVQPRATEGEEDGGQEQNHEAAGNGAAHGMDFQLDLEVDIVEEEVEEVENQQQRQPADNVPAAGEGAGNNQQQNPIPPRNQNQHQHPNAQQPMNWNDRPLNQGNIYIDARRVPKLVIGALIFPSISAAVGALLQVALPKTWTTPPGRWDRYPTGFLQSRFGRSFVGGCLVVALKDTISLYTKYRKAQNHKHRRIVDYQSKKGKAAPSH